MAVAMFMEYGNEVIQFPVNPEEIKLTRDGNNDIEEVVKLGEVNIAKDTKLATTEIECFFPQENIYPFILTKGDFKNPKFYIDFIEKVRKEKKPVRFIVSDTNINLLALIDDFEYGYGYGSDDVDYKLSLTEYREITVKVVKIEKKEEPKKEIEKPRPAPAEKKVTVGCEVMVNGRLHRDSWGKGPGKTLKNYHGKLNFVKTDNRSHPYHVTDLKGGWMGWVTKGSVKVL